MSRVFIPLNHNWKYKDSFEEKYLSPEYDDRDFLQVTLPHANREVPYNYFDEKMFQFVSCYRLTLELGERYKGKNIFLDFEGAMAYAEVFVNGEFIGSHKGGYTPFSMDITDKVTFDKPNIIAVKVDSTEREDIPPFGGAIDYLTFGGIYREVSLRIVDHLFIENLFVRPKDVLKKRKRVDYSLFIINTSTEPQNIHATVLVKEAERVLARAGEEMRIGKQTQERFDFGIFDIEDVKLWDIGDPNLYTFEMGVVSEDGAMEDSFTTRFGFRTVQMTQTGFLLNGRKIKLRGLNRHQTFPYVGQAMPARAQRRDADILKNELHLNCVRTSHYPQSKHFLDRCDEIGLLVFEEIPGWQHIGDKEWREVACENVREMITRDWNHPSIFLWGVRINESSDMHDFYTETNRLAHELDPTRQTGGVRCIEKSELLEDVYTMNDFSHSGGELVLRSQREVTGLGRLVPYLVTEFNGHMYPTKRSDHEERLIEHALRHARVQNGAAEDQEICGAIGWCAFDYNTHYYFGSGDRICHHGVMDMFRIPKFAAQFYRSQVHPEKEVVLEPATFWTPGDRSIGGIIPLTTFTNCDYVELYYGERLIGRFYPDRKTYRGLEYPPITIDTDTGLLFSEGVWEEGKFIGYIKDQRVIEKRFVKDPIPFRLTATPDDNLLLGDGRDVTRVVFRMVDQAGNMLAYIHDSLKLQVNGPGQTIGPDEIPLVGGAAAVWIKTKKEKGIITISAAGSRLSADDVTIQIQ